MDLDASKYKKLHEALLSAFPNRQTLKQMVRLQVVQSAAKLRDRYSLSFWDSLIIASAILGEASISYSEDMQNGLIIHNTLQIMNPFLCE